MNAKATPRLVLFVLMLVLAVPAEAQRFEWPEKAENLKVLPEDTPPQQLRATMISFVQGLGVRCEFCHDDTKGTRLTELDFAADTKETKDIARIMMKMVRRINGDELSEIDREDGARVRVTCITCHRGASVPRMLEDVLAEDIRTEGVEAAIAHYHELHERYQDGFAYDFRPNPLNNLGYTLLQAGQVDDAIAIFKLNVERHPDDWNVYDSLAEAYLTKGEPERAVALYQQSLILNPDNDNAVRMLKQIKGE